MKPSELRDLTEEELKTRLHDVEEELFNLKFRKGSQQQLANPLRIRILRREMARIKTILHENQLGIRKLSTAREKEE